MTVLSLLIKLDLIKGMFKTYLLKFPWEAIEHMLWSGSTMTCHHKSDNDHSLFTSKKPHFFKVILDEDTQEQKLEIPRNFIRKYGKGLPSPVQLEVPSGAKWEVQLTKCDQMVWLQEGWQEFAEHYSLKFGYFVVFRYEGNAHFHVLIFDKTASEIEYPYTITDITDDDDDDMSVELCDDDSHFPCRPPHKKMRTDLPNHPVEILSSRNCAEDPKSRKIKVENLKKVEKSATKGVGGITGWRTVKTEVLNRVRRLTATEKAHAVQRARAFKSTGNPAFVVAMQPWNLRRRDRIYMPENFVRKYFTGQDRNLTLCDSTGKTWPAKYSPSSNNRQNPRIHSGWRTFAEYHNLDVGDICVFKLIKHPDILLKVVINPVDQNASKACRPPADGSIAGRAKIRGLGSDTEPNHQRHRCQSSSREFKDSNIEENVNLCQKPELTSKMEPLTLTDKERAFMRSSAFKSANPSFTVRMNLSYANGATLYIPCQFSQRYLKNNSEVTLRVSDGRTWIVDYKRKSNRLHPSAKFRRNSLRAFVLDNNLKVGDVCVFELIDKKRILLEVGIFSGAEIASCSSSKLCE